MAVFFSAVDEEHIVLSWSSAKLQFHVNGSRMVTLRDLVHSLMLEPICK